MDNYYTKEVVKKLILAAAPEREEELKKLWELYSPQIELIDDKQGFCLEAGAFELVLFNHKSMAQLWILGFSAQFAFHAYSPYLIYLISSKLPIVSEVFQQDNLTVHVSNKAKILLHSTVKLNEIQSIEAFDWPIEVPEPSEGKPQDINGSMVFDLLCIGAAYCFLHEIKHVIFKKTGEEIDIHEEEFACDAFAREFLLEEIGIYSQQTDFNIENLTMKRAMSISLTSLLLLIITPHSKWGGSQSHPSIIERILSLIDYLDLPDDNYFWLYLSCIIILVLEHYNINFSLPVINSQKKLCKSLLNQLIA
ncbi:phage exclusion protein Lit family protein [Acinetobacter baumannii]|uniref:phage exclusion protein Lit family protein n=1 Tax=Acinetobacter baumannii TaxID=470 RepID=UPI0009337D38|nr:phage exclusion protein Lit family protein [Acinetobacter baumannii]